MALCELLGADPYVNGNVGSGHGPGDERVGGVPDPRRRLARWRRCAGRTAGTSRGGCRSGASGTRRGAAAATCAPRRTPTSPAGYGTYSRNHGGNRLYRIAAGATDDDLAWTEALMKAVSCLGCTREPPRPVPGHLLPLLHARRRRDRKSAATEFDRRAVLPHDGQGGRHRPGDHRAHAPSWTPTTRSGRSAWSGRVGHVVGRRAGHQPGLPVPAEHPARRPGRQPALRRLPPPRRAAADGEHRPDRQRAAGHDPHRRQTAAAGAAPRRTTSSR